MADLPKGRIEFHEPLTQAQMVSYNDPLEDLLRREAALTKERDGLREQLDAARELLDAAASWIENYPLSFDQTGEWAALADRLRAALGVVGPPANEGSGASAAREEKP